MHNLPFDKPGRFWKGNLHTHSTLSDGALTPEEVCRRYREAGYDFLALTEHFLPSYGYVIADTRPYRTDGFTTIIGGELHAGKLVNGERWHIVAVGLPFDFAQPTDQETGPEIARRAVDAGAFVAIAHPNWYSLQEADAHSLDFVHAVEIFNGIAVDANDKYDSWQLMDILTEQGHRFHAYAADDAHFTDRYADFNLGWVQVKSESREPDALVAALKAGHFYSSTGPLIHDLQLSPQAILSVRCSPADRIYAIGTGSKAQRVWGNGLGEAQLDLSGLNSPWFRVVVRDKRGGRAWSNPIWLE